MKYTTKEIIMMALTVTLVIVLGYVLYIIGSTLPIPGARFILFSPFLSFMLTILVVYIRKVGVITTFSFVFAVIMSFISIFMGAAIIASGLLTDFVNLLAFRGYNTNKKILFSVPFYSVFALLTSVYVAVYVTGNKLFMLTWGTLLSIILLGIIYVLGIIGTHFALRILQKKAFGNYRKL